ncbi:hypothetical protein B0H19DRAFT_1379972 [Mycena capillaripes]|nr:hypothetical protein B0H19DRAFT_1379972 [Mycena capillaripes]
MTGRASETLSVQYISGGTGGRGGGGEMGGTGGVGGGPTWDSQYDINTETFNMNNHWHLNLDQVTLDELFRQMAGSGGRGDFGSNFPTQPEAFAVFADDIAVHMPMPTPSFDAAAGHAHPTCPLPPATPDDATVPAPVSTLMPIPIPMSAATLTPTPTFDCVILSRLAADHAYPPFPQPPTPSDDVRIPFPMPMPPTRSFRSLFHRLWLRLLCRG